MDGYQEFLLSVRRDINCLCDNDRAVRRGAVVKLEKALLSGGKTQVAPAYLQRLFLEELHKPLFRMFADQGEKCREVSLSMTLRFSDLLPVQEVENVLPLLLAALLGRFRSQPFPEQSEELRLEALRVLSHLFDVCKEKLNPFASDILDALSKALTDSCPDAKKECCEITKKVSQYFDAERVSRAANPLVGSLLANLKHQQWKVRRATLESIGALLLQEATMMDHMEDVLPHLNALLNDRTPGVRQSLAETLERWLIKGLSFRVLPASNNFDDDGPEGFEKFESRLLILLLGVAADEEAEQVGAIALGGLERVAALKHEVLLKRAAKEREREEARRKAKEAREGKAEGYMEQEILEFFFPASRRKVKIQSVKIQRLLLLLTMPVFCLFCLELRADLGLVYRTPGTPVGHIPTLTGKARALCGWKITSTVDHDLCEDAFEQHFTSGSWKPDAMDHGNQRICCQVVAGDAGGGQQTHRTLSGCGVSSPLQGSRR
eukprot:symbB.v1.2.029896.t1/scaffold3318.1/size84623/5